jgi:hypothetical protein
MTVYARYETKSAPLSSDFARSFVERRFGNADLIYSLLPKFTRGPRKGLVKGYVTWIKCDRGGWARLNGALGQVLVPGTHDVQICVSSDASRGFEERSHHASNLTDEQWNECIVRAMTELFPKGK